MTALRTAGLLAVVGVVLCSAACADAPEPISEIVPSSVRDHVAEVEPWSRPDTHERTIQVGERERSYLLSVPPGAKQRGSLPMIFAFHGYGAVSYTHLTLPTKA